MPWPAGFTAQSTNSEPHPGDAHEESGLPQELGAPGRVGSSIHHTGDDAQISLGSDSGSSAEESEPQSRDTTAASDLLVAAEAAMQSFAMVETIQTRQTETIQPPNSNNATEEESEEEDDDSSEEEQSDEDDVEITKTEVAVAQKEVKDMCAEEEESAPQGPPRTKNELLLEDISSVNDDEILHPIDATEPLVGPIGDVMSFIMESPSRGTLIVRGVATGNPLNEDSLLCLESRQPIGTISEVFGPVKLPHYIVQLSARAMETIGARERLTEGVSIYSVSKRSHYITLATIMQYKGCDASNEHDEEVGQDQLEYSDDEEERVAKWKAKSKRKGGANDTSKTVNSKQANRRKPQPPTASYYPQSATMQHQQHHQQQQAYVQPSYQPASPYLPSYLNNPNFVPPPPGFSAPAAQPYPSQQSQYQQPQYQQPQYQQPQYGQQQQYQATGQMFSAQQQPNFFSLPAASTGNSAYAPLPIGQQPPQPPQYPYQGHQQR